MKLALVAALSTALIAVGAAQAIDTIGGSAAAPASSTVTTEDETNTTTTETTEDRTTTTGDDISGPCDEAEHANDPRCTGVDTGAPAQQPRGEVQERVDNSGPGSANSGPGSANSGPGSGDDDGGRGRGRGRGRGGDDD